MYSPRAHVGPLNRNTETAQPEGMHTPPFLQSAVPLAVELQEV